MVNNIGCRLYGKIENREPIAAAQPRLATLSAGRATLARLRLAALSNKVTRTAARFKKTVILEMLYPESSPLTVILEIFNPESCFLKYEILNQVQDDLLYFRNVFNDFRSFGSIR